MAEMTQAQKSPDAVQPEKSELDLLTSHDQIFDKRAIAIGLLLSFLLLVVALVYKLAVAPIDPAKRRAPQAFAFSLAKPASEDALSIKNPLREVLQMRNDKMDSIADMTAVAERPNIQMTTDPTNTIVLKDEFIQSDQVSIATPKIEVGNTTTETDIPDAPVEISFVTNQTRWAVPVIAAPTTEVADIPQYKDLSPRGKMATSFFNMAPAPGKPVNIEPQAFGPQDQNGVGPLGPMNINLPGHGDIFRPNPGAFVDLRARSAVDSALHWLALHQDPDGLWHVENLPETEKGQPSANLACTGFACLAFMGAGNTTRRGTYQRNVLRGIEALMKAQDAEGGWYKKVTGNHGGYTQGICTIALCEAFGRAYDERVGLAAQKALACSIKARNSDGGWRYHPNQGPSDTSVAAWFIQALKAAKIAKMRFDDSIYSQALTFLDSVTDENATQNSDGYVYYQPGHDVSGKQRPAITAAAMVIRQFTGIGIRNHLLVKGAEHIRNAPPDWKQKCFYYWYYATYAMHNMGEENRIWWNRRIRDILLENQCHSGPHAGSWDPKGDRWATAGSRVYTTSLGALCLEVYYRYNDALTSFGVPPSIDELFFGRSK
jgi:hypothetical protein